MTPDSLLRKFIAVSLLGMTLSIAGCTVAQKAPAAAAASESPEGARASDPDCGGCSDEGTGRYQYYLGILSVLLIG